MRLLGVEFKGEAIAEDDGWIVIAVFLLEFIPTLEEEVSRKCFALSVSGYDHQLRITADKD